MPKRKTIVKTNNHDQKILTVTINVVKRPQNYFTIFKFIYNTIDLNKNSKQNKVKNALNNYKNFLIMIKIIFS